ncbi:hypothetical protein PIB30_076652 [Stylosanthes scabra]|uniref:Caffeoyl-CoA O-methyltransferase n=1 Tax=Stylosanthes scabra TaxID=79078 RepID=A0ABU6YQN0_9FABA|nr:hypothetical protein [Stylosanthes scabra]
MLYWCAQPCQGRGPKFRSVTEMQPSLKLPSTGFGSFSLGSRNRGSGFGLQAFLCDLLVPRAFFSHFRFELYPLKLETLERTHQDIDKNKGKFDFVFVDADKDNYLNYHKRLIELVRVGGLIAYDNTLWSGSVVAPPDAPMGITVKTYRSFVIEFNEMIAADSRVEICQLSVGDGITLCRRII